MTARRWLRLAWLWAIRHRHEPETVTRSGHYFELSRRLIVHGRCRCGERVYVCVDRSLDVSGRGTAIERELFQQMEGTLFAGVMAEWPRGA